MNLWACSKHTAHAALLAAGLMGMGVVAGGSLSAQEVSGGTNSQPGRAITVALDYREVDFDFIHWMLTATKRSGAFSKEPPFDRHNLTRGMLRLGGGASNEMAFVWDRTAGKLYLDLNRNLDLTDDPGGVFPSRGGLGDNYQDFTGVHLPLRTAAGECQALVDLNFYGFTGLRCSAGMRSFWQGKVSLEGVDWQVGLLENPFGSSLSLESGNLLLRPWTERNKPFSLNGSSLDAFPFSRKLFVGGHGYQLQCTGTAQGGAARVQVQFTEQQPKLGELKITGDFVHRVTLEGGSYMVVLDQPGAVERVPVGSYGPFRVWLKKGDVEAHLGGREQALARRIIINDRQPAVLAVGGPLTNTVTISRRGRSLSMDYQLVGLGGVYELGERDRLHPPEVTVYQGDRKIASGKFQFG